MHKCAVGINEGIAKDLVFFASKNSHRDDFNSPF